MYYFVNWNFYLYLHNPIYSKLIVSKISTKKFLKFDSLKISNILSMAKFWFSVTSHKKSTRYTQFKRNQ